MQRKKETKKVGHNWKNKEITIMTPIVVQALQSISSFRTVF